LTIVSNVRDFEDSRIQKVLQ